MTRETIGVYGGSFDPPHRGHVALVRAALERNLVDRAIVVPVYAHALHKKSTAFAERVAMARLAFGVLDRVLVSAIEETLPAPSYTLNTLIALGSENPGASLRLLVGTDILAELPRWHHVEEVKALAPLLVFRRAGVEFGEGIEAELPEVSSSELRHLLAEPRSQKRTSRLRELLGDDVFAFVERGRLYATDGGSHFR